MRMTKVHKDKVFCFQVTRRLTRLVYMCIRVGEVTLDCILFIGRKKSSLQDETKDA